MNSKSRTKNVDNSQIVADNEDVNTDPSLTSRIGTSAAGLLQNTLGAPAGELAETLASSTAGTSKSSSSSSRSPSFQYHVQAFSSGKSTQSNRARETARLYPYGEVFRSSRVYGANDVATAQGTFDEWANRSRKYANDGDVFFADSSHDITAQDHGAGDEGFVNLDSVRSDKTKSQRLPSIDRQFQIKSAMPKDHDHRLEDGAEVIALLSDPTFCLEDDLADSWDTGSGTFKDASNGIGKTYRQSGNPATVSTRSEENLLDLIPDFNMPSEHPVAPMSAEDGIPTADDMQPWIEILDRYHDEVWGDMLPLVQEAREEIRAASGNKEGALQDRPAIRRLTMLLGHLEISVV